MSGADNLHDTIRIKCSFAIDAQKATPSEFIECIWKSKKAIDELESCFMKNFSIEKAFPGYSPGAARTQGKTHHICDFDYVDGEWGLSHFLL